MKETPIVFAPGTLVPDCLFDPQKDISAVDQFGFVDLCDAYVNGSIPGDLMVDESSYNGVDDPASLVGRSTDVFDAIRKASAVTSAAPAEQQGAATSAGKTE